MGICSSSCFPFTAPPPTPPTTILDVPVHTNSHPGEGHTFVISSSNNDEPWFTTSDVQWKIKNAEGEDWLYITTNSDWDHFESVKKGLWAIIRCYPDNSSNPETNGPTTTATTTTKTKKKNKKKKKKKNLMSVYLSLQRSRGMVLATFVENSRDVATASWFVTPAAIECMGCQVAVELRDHHKKKEEKFNCV